MVAQILFNSVSARSTSIMTRRQSQPGSSQNNSKKPYSPSGMSVRPETVTDRISRAASSGKRSINGIMGIGHLQRSAILSCAGGIVTKMLDKSGHASYVKLDECAIGEPSTAANT